MEIKTGYKYSFFFSFSVFFFRGWGFLMIQTTYQFYSEGF